MKAVQQSHFVASAQVWGHCSLSSHWNSGVVCGKDAGILQQSALIKGLGAAGINAQQMPEFPSESACG